MFLLIIDLKERKINIYQDGSSTQKDARLY